MPAIARRRQDVAGQTQQTWFGRAWRQPRVHFARYQAVFKLTRRTAERADEISGHLERRDAVQGGHNSSEASVSGGEGSPSTQ